jgi:hypothetical protein
VGTFNVDFGDDSSDLSSFDLSDVSYTGLDDTASSFTGSSTLSPPLAGSPLQLSTGLNLGGSSPSLLDPAQNEQELTAGSAIFPSQVQSNSLETGASFAPSSASAVTPSGNLAVSGNSDPAWTSDDYATPYPSASPLSTSMSSAVGSLSKFGAGIAQMFGAEILETPQTQTAQPNTAGTSATLPVSSTKTVILVIAVAALILLLAKSKPGGAGAV